MRRPLSLVLLAVLLAAAGCGGGGGKPRAETAPTAASYRQDLRALCKKVLREAQEIGAALSSPDVLVERLLKATRRSQARMAALDPPPALAALHGRALREGELSLRHLAELGDALRSGASVAEATRRFVRRLRPLLRSSKRVYGKLGVPECARAPGEPAPA